MLAGLLLYWQSVICSGAVQRYILSGKRSRLLQEITGHKCALTPSLALLSLGIEQFPPLRKVVIHILFATRITLEKEWRSKTSPKIEDVVSRKNTQKNAYKEGRAMVFHKYWDI